MGNYIICYDRDGSPYLEHAWKKHKYVAIKNGQYIYPEDLVKARNNNYQAVKEQQKKVNKELKKAQRKGKRDYERANKTNTWLDKHKNDTGGNMLQMKQKELKQKQYEKEYAKYHEGKRERDEIRKRQKMADMLVESEGKKYEAAKKRSDDINRRVRKSKELQMKRKVSDIKNDTKKKLEISSEKANATLDDLKKWRQDMQTKHTKIESGGGHTAAEWASEQEKKRKNSKKKEN